MRPYFPILLSWRERTLHPLDALPFVPWAMLAPHEAQAHSNHGQTLRRLADRGGLGPNEMLAILDDVAFYQHPSARLPIEDQLARLRARVDAWTAAQPCATPADGDLNDAPKE